MIRAVVDRIDEGVAVLILCGAAGKTITLPSSLLADGSKEGDIVSLSVQPDPDATQTDRAQVAATIERLRKL
jgi:hypothetical protein